MKYEFFSCIFVITILSINLKEGSFNFIGLKESGLFLVVIVTSILIDKLMDRLKFKRVNDTKGFKCCLVVELGVIFIINLIIDTAKVINYKV